MSKKNDIGFTAKSRYLYWNKTALDCYERHCKCEGCLLDKIVRQQISYDPKVEFEKDPKRRPCQMKATVLELIRLIGKPKKKEVKIENTEPIF